MKLTQAQFHHLLTLLIPGYPHPEFCRECEKEEKNCECDVFIKESPFTVRY